MTESEVKTFIDKKASEIIEHFDTVQVFVTWHDGGKESTSCYEMGKGNFYARQGQIDEWLRIQHQYQKNHADRKDAQAQDESGSD